MVVLVLMTSCQVSLNPKKGPVTAQPTMISTARRKASGSPMALAAPVAKRPKNERWYIGLPCISMGGAIVRPWPGTGSLEPPQHPPHGCPASLSACVLGGSWHSDRHDGTVCSH